MNSRESSFLAVGVTALAERRWRGLDLPPPPPAALPSPERLVKFHPNQTHADSYPPRRALSRLSPVALPQLPDEHRPEPRSPISMPIPRCRPARVSAGRPSGTRASARGAGPSASRRSCSRRSSSSGARRRDCAAARPSPRSAPTFLDLLRCEDEYVGAHVSRDRIIASVLLSLPGCASATCGG